MYYVKATGDNRYGQGTDKWVKIKNVVKKSPDVYELEVYFKKRRRFVLVSLSKLNDIPLEFAKNWNSLELVSFNEVIKAFDL